MLAASGALVLPLLFASTSASAYVLKETSGGQPVKWPGASESFVIDPSVDAASTGGSAAVATAVQGWSGAGGAPALTTSVGPGGAQPAIDGQNSILFAPDGFAPAGNALAVTLVSFDETTGAIVDTDIVINGKHRFAVLPAGTSHASGDAPLSNEAGGSAGPGGASGGGMGEGSGSGSEGAFDLEHVLAHETGHALGLGDVRQDSTALMYAYSWPDDASMRAPAGDDTQGIVALYGASPPAAGSRAGCGSSSVGGAQVGGADAWVGLAGVLLVLASRRGRSRVRSRVYVPFLVAGLVLVGDAGVAQSAAGSRAGVEGAMKGVTGATASARAKVIHATTRDVGGVLETTLELSPISCPSEHCPAHSLARVWGGTLNGITEQVGEQPPPRVGDVVDVAFTGGREACDGCKGKAFATASVIAPTP